MVALVLIAALTLLVLALLPGVGLPARWLTMHAVPGEHGLKRPS